MHHTHLNEILRDAAVAESIRSIIDRNKLTFAETRDALMALGVPRAAGIAALVTSR